MGLLNWLGFGRAPDTALSPPTLATPWADPSHLLPVITADIFGLVNPEDGPVTRSLAMQVPAVVRGRGLICGTLSRYPLTAYQGDTELVDQPAWLSNSSTATAPRTRMVWTLDDLVFHGQSLWAVERDTAGQITDAARVHPGSWRVDYAGRIEIVNANGVWRVARSSEVIHFSSHQDALTLAGATAIRSAHAIGKAVASRAASPIPLIDLHLSEDVEDEEAKATATAWAKARSSPGGAVAVTPPGVTATAMNGSSEGDWLIGARNAARLDIANCLGVPASLLEGSVATASLTYSTSEGKRSELIDYGLNMWATAIEDRLSMDDVTPPGTRIAFDLSALTELPQDGHGPSLED
jgi:phage portal protein BeeE